MSGLMFGWSCKEFSIDEPVAIPGQMVVRLSEGIHDPLTATALCIDGGPDGDMVILLSADITSWQQPVIDRLRQLVTACCPQIPPQAIIVNATHTHSSMPIGPGPETAPDGRTVYPWQKSRDHFLKVCTQVVCEAYQNRKAGGMTYGYGYAVVGHVRRTVYLDDYSKRSTADAAPNGRGVMYGNSNDPMFSHFETGADHFLNVLFTFDSANRLTGMIVNVPCPSQVNANLKKLSADFWHETRQQLRAEYGQDIYILPQCAAAGDIAPRNMHYYEAHARKMGLKYDLYFEPGKMGSYNRYMADRQDIAERITQAVKEVFLWACRDIRTDVPVRHICKTVCLPLRGITEEEKNWCLQNLRELEENPPDENLPPEQYRKVMSRRNSVRNRNQRAIDRFYAQQETGTLETDIHLIRLGDMAIATNRFELFQDYMHRIQARSPFVQTFVVQLAGSGWGSYLPTQQAVDNKGYSASLFCNKVGPEGGQQLVEHTLTGLNELLGDKE